jgi:putative membrane protein
VTRAAQAGQAEVALAKLALQRSQNGNVKLLAAMIQLDQESTNASLKSVVERHGVRLRALSVAQQAAYDRLKTLSGTTFDRAWTAQMLKNQNEAVVLFTYAAKSLDADLKALADSTLPTLRAHLKGIDTVNGAMGQ